MNAVAMLDKWLAEGDARDFSDVVDELRVAVTHLAECNGWQCGTWQHSKDHEMSPCDPTRECAIPCEDCKAYREGQAGTFSSTRSVFALLDELETRDERLQRTLEVAV